MLSITFRFVTQFLTLVGIVLPESLPMFKTSSNKLPPGHSPRMTDVALAAGVSVMTVSRALKPATHVAPATRALVLKVVKELGYVPDLLAGGLSSKRSGFVSLLVPSLNNPHFAETVMGMKRVLEPAGIQVLLGFTNYQAREEERLVEWMLKRRPEAIVLTYDGHTTRTREILKSSGVPIIEIWEKPAKPIEHVVGFSNRKAARMMTSELIKLGYQRIAYIGESSDADTRGHQRRRGFEDAMRHAGLDYERQIAYAPPPIGMAQGREAFRALINRYPDTDAVMCVSDPCAFGVLTYCLERGWSIPERIAIAGFGAFEISACCVPSISTLAISGEEIGVKAASLILELISEASHAPPSSRLRLLEVGAKPVLRESTKKRAP
jgi:LacI family transcriptional regulator, gluconate utilization system Gnt-I transcriptional repressor